MTTAEKAQRGVIEAILGLNQEGIFRAVLDHLLDCVYPMYLVLNSPILEEPTFGPPPDPPRYAPHRAIRFQQHEDFENALRKWAQRFRLTRDLTETGECLPWALDFGRALCSGKSVVLSSEPHIGQEMPPPGGWLRVGEPNTLTETRGVWLHRIKTELKEHYAAAHKRQRARPYADPAKRKPVHYRWFVLAVCGDCTPGNVAKTLNVELQDDAVRKGIRSVSKMLGVNRK